jgi:hypothetical protein
MKNDVIDEIDLNYNIISQVEKHADLENKYEKFKSKLSTEKYQEGIFGARPQTLLPNLIVRNAEGNL